MAWNSRLAPNGPHTLRARARDASGNTTTSAPVDITVDSTLAPPPGLVAGYGFDGSSGATVSDASGNGNSGTLENGVTRTPIGKFGGALRFDGLDDMVSIPDASSLDLTTGMTLSAWVKLDQIDGAWRTLIMKENGLGSDVYGFYAADGVRVPNGEVNTGTSGGIQGPSAVSTTAWTYLALTYDGSTIRLYVDGALVASKAKTGSILNSTGALRIGGNRSWPNEYFKGLIDEVRVYNRALPQAEIQSDMAIGISRDTTAPTVTGVTPGESDVDLPINPSITARFSEPMDPATLTTDTVTLRDPANTVVPAAITYDELAAKVTIKPNAALRYGTRYTATIKGGASGTRARDRAGNALSVDRSWSFTTEPAPPPMLLITGSNPFSTYTGELLKAEGLNEYASADISLVDAAYLANFHVVVLGDVPLTATQVTTLTNWVNGGGNLIALHPDKKLAGLLGITDLGTTLTNGYLKVDTAGSPGAGIVGQTIQFHGTADRYALSGARAVATLYGDISTATSSPAVTTRDVGAQGGQAMAFTFDLAKSVSLTRQGNPAWVGQNRDGVSSIRSNDLFWGNMLGDPQPDWVNTSRIQIPQADEQQRLLANMVFDSTLDTQPLPRFWYLPRGEKAAIVMTGDDHAVGGTAPRWDQYIGYSPPGCSVALWQCVRGTSYIYPASPLTDAQAADYTSKGFEVALHVNKGSCTDFTAAQLEDRYTLQLNEFAANYPSVPAPQTERTHCTTWTDWSSQAKIQVNHGISLDTNYYHYPSAWANLPGFMTGSGLPMKFADLDGTTIDDYQAATQMDDEAEQPYPATVDALLDKALGPEGYYGTFVTLMHTDKAISAGSDAIVASAQARNVPIISAKQLLDWMRGRDGSSFRQMSWDGSALQFTVREPAVDHVRRQSRAVHQEDRQGHRVRVLHRHGRDVPGGVRMTVDGGAGTAPPHVASDLDLRTVPKLWSSVRTGAHLACRQR
jgi:hypothetical protein